MPDDMEQLTTSMPPEARRFLDNLKVILETPSAPHECAEGCRCRKAIRRAIAENLGDYHA